MRNPLVYIKNGLWGVLWKLRFGSGLSMGMIQSFDTLHPEIRRGGRIDMGSYNQNRGGLWLVADGGRLRIGSHCFFNTGCCITAMEQVTIGDRCKFGNNLVIVDQDHNYKRRSEQEPEFLTTPVCIGNDVWVGANVTILRGTTIGDHCVIGAGCVVKGDVPAGTVMTGPKAKAR